MTKVDKQINTILSRIDWNLLGYCISSEKDSKNRNIEEVISAEKEKVIKRLRFIAVTKMDELVCDYWIIKYDKKEEMVQLFFTPFFQISGLGSKEKTEIEKPTMIETEFKVLHDMLEKARKEENYELCQVIKNRLEDIIKEMP
jgi:hypothetical protein